ncbi:hypothetical protein TNIN_63401 [Trichonephila inaurata madagascariensis]|uniref:Uncharacterized protein n=1 Tax=Trichonephila inaurata madagascariensis TaxID=2747483 RepID=A0A8X6IIU5_9ARAC|nr:hypothetical protein TNIN_63401 [Trichonephila inaurata madagascariensis]
MVRPNHGNNNERFCSFRWNKVPSVGKTALIETRGRNSATVAGGEGIFRICCHGDKVGGASAMVVQWQWCIGTPIRRRSPLASRQRGGWKGGSPVDTAMPALIG